jgi:hypothetical protein
VTSVTVCGFHPILTTLGSKDITLNVFLKFLIRWINNFSTVDALQLPTDGRMGGVRTRVFC